MARQDQSFSYEVLHRNELVQEDQELLLKALEATRSAYAPYSQFNVGVAIRTADHKIIQGSNQENGAFPIGQCAERVALYRLIHEEGRRPIGTIAIVVDHAESLSPASPCGACRQLLTEYRSQQQSPIRLILAASKSDEVFEIHDVTDLLPLAFDGSFLGV